MALITVKKVCGTIRKHVKPFIGPKLIEKIIITFEILHEIPYNLCDVCGNHISIITLKIGSKLFCSHKSLLLHIDL
jgi:hypothetical protein